MIDTIGGINWIAFVIGWIFNKLTGLVVITTSLADNPIFKNWTDLMFGISATGAAIYTILKIITWSKNNKKTKK